MEGTFHRRELKEPAIAFGSPVGKGLFAEALAQGTLEGYFFLAEHFQTQGHPAYCGLGSLTMALNSLLIDPKRTWQGVWRWFDESFLSCCEPLDVVKLKGITLPKLACLARCNGATATLNYASETTEDVFRNDVKLVCSQRNPDGSPCVQVIMIVSYARPVLCQSGSGHFSPIGAYNIEKDMVLIMDVARFKYPPHWVPLSLLFEAMQKEDPETSKTRGYLLLATSSELITMSCGGCCDDISNDEVIANGRASGDVKDSSCGSTSTDTDSAKRSGIDADAHAKLKSLVEHSCPFCASK